MAERYAQTDPLVISAVTADQGRIIAAVVSGSVSSAPARSFITDSRLK